MNRDLQRTITSGEGTEWEVACSALAQRLGEELRAAKSAQLSCGEVLLPRELLPTVASQILAQSVCEPCGLRGCTLDIQLETEEGSQVKISSIKWDPQMSSTFLLSLTLRQEKKRKGRLSQLLKFLTKKRTHNHNQRHILSKDFHLLKTRLYRSLDKTR
ncbi:protein charybde-like [Macrosteles quadrilineatus]|uniref:protein charybde-like n=1 Tax=Macrosteles quadrilineatus TaxID=74068 RepID=UPI0023E1AC9F|nr:protein charybde-like [Macrosteles quadrilineatus]